MSVNDRTIEMVNRSIDGELSESELIECEALLADSDEARAYKQEISDLVELLHSTPSVEPPEELQHDILSQIVLPLPHKWFTWTAGWMRGRPVSYGLAVAAGLLATVAFYELSPATTSSGDLSNMVGTLARGNGPTNIIQLSFLDIDVPGVQGRVQLRGSGDLKLLQFDVNSNQAVDFVVSLAGSGLSFGGFAREAEGVDDSFNYSQGSFSVASLGAKKFTVILTDASSEDTGNGGIVVSVKQEGEDVYQGVLSL